MRYPLVAGVVLLFGAVQLPLCAAGTRPLDELVGAPAHDVFARPEMKHIVLRKQVTTTPSGADGKLSDFSHVERVYSDSNGCVRISTVSKTNTVEPRRGEEYVRSIDVICAHWSNNVLAAFFALPVSTATTPSELLATRGRADVDDESPPGRRVICYDHRGERLISDNFTFIAGRLERITVSRW